MALSLKGYILSSSRVSVGAAKQEVTNATTTHIKPLMFFGAHVTNKITAAPDDTGPATSFKKH